MKKLVLTFVLIWVSACAYSPQQITLQPRIETGGESYGNGRSVAVSSVDERANPILGTRGGLYKETSVISIANDMNEAIVRATQAKLATQGFNVNSSQSDANLTVVVEALSYDIPDQKVIKKVDLRCVIRIDVEAGNEHYTGRFRTSSEQQTVVSPGMERNEQMVNQLLSDTLARAFSDPKLKAFLSNI